MTKETDLQQNGADSMKNAFGEERSVDKVRRRLRDLLTPEYGAGEAEAMTRLIFSALKGWSVTDLLIRADTQLSEFIISEIESILKRLGEGEPIQYILGKARFYGMDFSVNQAVLIPRPETEELVDTIMRENADRKDLRVLDLCTGSGCIAIALARHLPFSQVVAVDISAEALEVARKNSTDLHTSVAFRQQDILDLDSSALTADTYDIIVSNPPYICEREKTEMERNVLDYEPDIALFVPDDDPLKFYRPIAEIARKTLSDEGKLYLEINPLYHKEIEKMLMAKGFTDVITINDISRRPRFIRATLRNLHD